MSTKPPILNRYYPRLSSVVTENDIPDILGFIRTGIIKLLDHIYFKDLQYSKSPKGDAAFYSLSIVSKRIDIEIPGTGIFLVLNPDFQGNDNNISAFPITIEYQWKILAYLRFFSVGNFSFDPQQIFEVALRVLNITEEQAIAHFVTTFVDPEDQDISPLQQFVKDINGAEVLDSPLTLPTDATTLQDLVAEMFNKSGGKYASLLAFSVYLGTTDLQETSANVKIYFRSLIPQDIDAFIKDVIIPKFRATLLLSAGIEFPRNVLVPVYPEGTKIGDDDVSLEPIPEKPENSPNRVMLRFGEALFYADTEKGFGYNMDLVLDLNYPAGIGKTGLVIDINNLKIDLSTKENIAEADADGRPKEFMGVYMEYTEIFLPKKWFKKQDNQTIGISANNLLVGTGGVSGNISVRATYPTKVENDKKIVINYFTDYFSLKYPIKVKGKETEITDHSQLLHFINIELDSPSMLKFEFPLSLTTKSDDEIEIFKTESEYFQFLKDLNPHIDIYDPQSYMWFDLGDHKNSGNKKYWRLGFQKFEINFHHGQVVYSHLHAALEIKKFKKLDVDNNVIDSILYIELLGEWESSENFKLSSRFLPEGLKITLFKSIILTLQSAELGRNGGDFFIGADTKLKFPNDKTAIGRIFKGKEIDLPAIRIYSNGRFEITGGIGFIPANFTLPLGPVEMSVTGIHLGSIQREFSGKIRNYNYIGFDGALNVDPIGLDVMGNGIKYFYTVDDDEYLNIEGKPTGDRFLHISTLSIDLIIPGNASEEQAIAIIKGSLTIPDPGVSDEFGGSVSVKIPKAKISGEAYMKLNPKNKSFLVSAAVELGTPIPLGPIGIYGFKGLIGKKYIADKKAVFPDDNGKTWYDYYVAPRAGVNEEKLRNPSQAEGYTNPFSVGLGASMATVADGGRAISLRTMMLLSLPNMFAIDAGLAILSDRLGLIESDKRVPPFYAFLIIGDDALEFGVGANYQINKSSGWFIDIKGEMQAGFFFKNQKPWYINFGTKEKPITALMFKDILNIKAQGFLMISAAGIEAGAKTGFDFDFFIARAWVMVEVGAHVSFERPQVGGYLYIEGGFALNFWFLQVSIAANVFFSVEMANPFLIFAQLRVDLRVKITWLFTFKFKVTLTFKWQKPGKINHTAIAALTYEAGDPDYAKKIRTEDSVKGVHMLTNESFGLTFINVSQNEVGTLPIYPRTTASIDAIIPMDTFIDIKMEKGLAPSASVDAVIGSHTSAANNCIEFIPPVGTVKGGLVLKQVKHKYSIESISIKMESGGFWVDYHPYEALFSTGGAADVSSLKIGHWQKNTDQYDSIRVLATSPFSYMDPGEPGWVVPEQYGITPSSLFCTTQISDWHVSNFLNIPLGTEYVPPVGYDSYLICGAYYNIEGTYAKTVDVDLEGNTVEVISNAKMVVKNAFNPFNYDHSLEFSNGDNLILTFPEDSARVKMNLTTFAKGITVKMYERVKNNAIKPKYVQIDEVYYTKEQLAGPIEIGNPERDVAEGGRPQSFSKIKIIPDANDKDRIEAIHQEIAAVWLEAETNSGEASVVVLTPQQSALLDTLNAELALLRDTACAEQNCKSIAFRMLGIHYLNSYDQVLTNFINDEESLINVLGLMGYPHPVNVDFNKNSIIILNLSMDIADYGFVTNGVKKIVDKGDHLCISLFEESRLGGGPSGPDETGKSDPHSTGQFKFAIIQIEKMATKPMEETYSDCGCNGNGGSDAFTSICTTSLQEVRWQTLTQFEYEQTIPEQHEVSGNTQATVDAMSKTLQPIWRPDTKFILHFRLKDDVNDGSTDSKVFDYFYGFKTMGPVGHFHKQNGKYMQYKVYNESTRTYETKTRKEDESALTSLRSYIDYLRSYPNPDGNLLGSKPLFYGNQQCKIDLFFDKPYTSHMFNTWASYNGREEILMDMPIAIKDPISDVVIPYPLPEDWLEEDVPAVKYNWEDISDPNNLPLSIQTYLNLLDEAVNGSNNPVSCDVKLGDLVSPSVKMRTVNLSNLKPEKLYTAIVYSSYDADGNGEIRNQENRGLITYEESQKIHEFAFRTSRYENFRKQVTSYQINEIDDNGNIIDSKQAVYEVRLDLTTSQVSNLYALVSRTPNIETNLLREKYIHEFDRALEGILKISPLDPPGNTDFVKIMNNTNNNVVAILVRNPEPFNDPRIQLRDISDTLVVLGAKASDVRYKVLWSKDYSQAIIMNESKNITEIELQFQFIYKTWDGNQTKYVVKNELDINEEQKLYTVVTEPIIINK